MTDLLFFGYSHLKGYTFDIINNSQPINIRSFITQDAEQEEKIILASYRGIMVGAMKFKIVSLPDSLFAEIKPASSGATQSVALIDLYFLNEANGVAQSTVLAGLMLKLQRFARKNGCEMAVGYAHDDFTQIIARDRKFRLFNIKKEQLLPCDEGLSAIFSNLDKPFLIDFKKSLVSVFKKAQPQLGLSFVPSLPVQKAA